MTHSPDTAKIKHKSLPCSLTNGFANAHDEAIELIAGYLKDCLSSFSSETVQFDFLDANSPVMIADDRLTYILMPLRV